MSAHGILIADEDLASRRQMAELLSGAGYEVDAPASLAGALLGILKKTVKVVVLSSRFDHLLATEVIPVLKKCNRDLRIILVASELPAAALRKAREEGVFYHALPPEQAEDVEELRQAVDCALHEKK